MRHICYDCRTELISDEIYETHKKGCAHRQAARDRYACAAVAGLAGTTGDTGRPILVGKVVDRSLEIADAMLEARVIPNPVRQPEEEDATFQ